jgi:hypothetical protein
MPDKTLDDQAGTLAYLAYKAADAMLAERRKR